MFDVVVIGSGPGGYVTAIKGAQMGGKVALVEGHKIGGCCLNVGCIPTKALVHSATTYLNTKEAAKFGVETGEVKLNLPAAMAHKAKTVQQLVGGVEMLLKGYGVTVYRWWAKDARSWRKGLMMGAGHGGIEAAIVGGLVMVGFINMLAARSMDLSSIYSGDQLAAAQAEITRYWNLAWYEPLAGALERAFTIPAHIALSILVLQVFTRKQARWLWAAVGWHALINAGAVYLANTSGIWITEATLGAIALFNFWLIRRLRQPEPEEPEDDTGETPPPLTADQIDLQPLDENSVNIDESRFSK